MALDVPSYAEQSATLSDTDENVFERRCELAAIIIDGDRSYSARRPSYRSARMASRKASFTSTANRPASVAE